MDYRIFVLVLVVGISLVALQGLLAYADGYLTQAQMQARGIHNGWSLMEHGGMWADVFIISPLVAYSMSKYGLGHVSMRSLATLFGAVVVVLVALEVYRRGGINTPEAHTHDGRTTPAGLIHGLFAVAVIYVGVHVYFGWTAPVVSKTDIIIFSLLLTPFFYLGVAKFNARWVFDTGARWQVAVGVLAIWAVTIIRLRY